MFLHIIPKHNPNNRREKKIYVYHGGFEYICTKKIVVIMYWKTQYVFLKIEFLKIFMKFVIFI